MGINNGNKTEDYEQEENKGSKEETRIKKREQQGVEKHTKMQ